MFTSYGKLKAFPATVAITLAGAIIYSQFERKRRLEAPTATSPSSQQKYFTSGISFPLLTLESSQQVNHNTKRLRFALPENDMIGGQTPCSSLLTFALTKNAWFPTIRPYTPISDPDTPGYVELLVKLYPNGKMSGHLHSLQPGDTLRVKKGPLQDYPWSPNKHSDLALIAGGAGITPMVQLLRSILKNPEDKTNISLVFGVNGDQDVLFADEFRDLEAKYPGRFKVTYTVSHPSELSPYPKGYVTKELLARTIPKPTEGDVKVLVCGPPNMAKALVGKRSWFTSEGSSILSEMGFSKDQVQTIG